MPYAGPSPFAGVATFAGAAAQPPSSPPATASFLAGPFAGARPFAGPAPFAGATAVPGGGPPPPATLVTSADSASVVDGLKATAGGAFALFDAFTDGGGTPLESHAPTGGSGAWSKHPSYVSGSLSIGSYDRLGRNNALAATSVYITDRSGTDARATWTTGDDDVVYVADSRCGVGLRVSPSADTGYYAIASNDDGSSTYRWAILKRVAGAETVLATAAKPSLVLPSASLDFSAVGSFLTLKVDGAVVATATDSSITAPGRFAVLFRPPVGEGGAAGSWIDDLWVGDVGVATNLVPERVFAGVGGAEYIGVADRFHLIASLIVFASVDAFGAAEGYGVAARVAGAIEAVGLAEARWASCSIRSGDSAGWGRSDAASVSVLVQAAEAAGVDEAGVDEAGVVSAFLAASETVASLDAQVILASVSLATIAGVDEGRAAEAASVAATLAAGEAASWSDERAAIRAGLWASEALAADSAWATRSILATLTYSIYGNDGDGGPIDYGTALATTTETHWSTSPLSVPGVYRFAVRSQTGVGGEEKNLDAEVVIRLDATGIDITGIPGPPTALAAASIKGGAIRVTWAPPANASDRATAPTGYRVYATAAPGPLAYTTPAATVPAGPTRAGTCTATLTGLVDGVSYLIGVRAYNDAGEEANAVTVAAASDATGPAPVLNLTISTDPEDWS